MKEEIFGPVLSVYVANSWDEAIAVENKNVYGNAASVFTEKGSNAEWFVQRFRAGLLGINDAFAGSRGASFIFAVLPFLLANFCWLMFANYFFLQNPTPVAGCAAH